MVLAGHGRLAGRGGPEVLAGIANQRTRTGVSVLSCARTRMR